jgi:hypothetical protein
MGRYSIEVDGKTIEVEASSRRDAMYIFRVKGYGVMVPDITAVDHPNALRPKLPAKITLSIRLPISAIDELVAMGIIEPADQKKYAVEALLEKIGRDKGPTLDQPSQ